MEQMIKILRAEFRMLLGELKNYSINYIFHNISMIFLFLGIFLSFNYQNNLNSAILLLSLLAWNMGNSTLSSLPYIIQDESSLGTLEQIFMTRTSIYKLLSAKVIVNITFDLTRGIILFILCSSILNVITVYSVLNIGKIALIILIYIILAITFNFMGLIFAGLALFYKRVGSLINVFSYILLFFSGATIGSDKIPSIINIIFNIIPLKWFKLLMEGLIINNSSSANNFMNNFFCFIGVALFWAIIGIFFFKKLLFKAKENGKLGHY